jgi:hypothetical protein
MQRKIKFTRQFKRRFPRKNITEMYSVVYKTKRMDRQDRYGPTFVHFLQGMYNNQLGIFKIIVGKLSGQIW